MKLNFKVACVAALFVVLGICLIAFAPQQNQNNFGGQGSGSSGFSGVPTRASTCSGNVDTILGTGGVTGQGDRLGYVFENDASACAVSLPQAGSANFGNSFANGLCDQGAGTSTVTPVAPSTLNIFTGTGFSSGQTSIPITTGQCAIFISDNTNYWVVEFSGGGGGNFPDLTDVSGTSLTTAVPFLFGGSLTAKSGNTPQWFRQNANGICFAAEGDACDMKVDASGGFSMGSSFGLGWTPSIGNATGSMDTVVSRCGAACITAGASQNATDTSGAVRGSVLSTYDSETTTNVGSHMDWTRAACETAFAATTVNTGSATTTTGQNCLPANAVVDYVVYRITTTITTATSFTVGITGTTSKFCSTQSTLTSGTTGLCAAQTGTAAALDGTSAAPVIVTFNSTPGAGAIRLVVFYHIAVAPTS